ncbi:hypothetical protein Scep_029867 [Stephania cephalantha]|uniref:Uncharacterized protein n=1 Tax=Stephania cephalantha TaxID=152367 RepID=A0AAP0DYJ2_9MAGN
MSGNLFEGLPPPSLKPPTSVDSVADQHPVREPSPPPPAPVLKSALKRQKPPEQQTEGATASTKQLRFKTTVDASEKQVIEAMQKIASHIVNPSKFSKASKLAVQLIQAGIVKAGTSDHFFAILEGAILSPTAFADPTLRAEYHALFTAAQDVSDFLSKKQRNHLTAWTIKAVLANDLCTDDSFVFSRASGKIKEYISSLPLATEDEDLEEAEALKEDSRAEGTNDSHQEKPPGSFSESHEKVELDPFGLDVLFPNTSRKDAKAKTKKEMMSLSKKVDEEFKRFIKSQREAIILCLETSARRYKIPWCQTVIDLLVKHAFDNKERFTSRQRDAIEKLWASIREQQTRRKQGKSVTGKLDVNGFEWLQQKYANEKISIRHAVGGGGQRRAEQWLG